MDRSAPPLILIADDDMLILKALTEQLRAWGYRTASARDKGEVFQRLADEGPELLLLDLHLGDQNSLDFLAEILQRWPRLLVVVLTGYGCIDSAVCAIKMGAYEYLTKPLESSRLRTVLEHALGQDQLQRRIRQLEKAVASYEPGHRIRGDSAPVTRLRQSIASVAGTEATVLILGESGTGKELVAHALHEQSGRGNGPLVPVNVATLPRELLESELFGHEKGAFTGATQARIGCCEAADGGTLFLDEIGELGVDLQAKLLRFLQDRTFQRVGSSKTVSVDVRVVAATNRDLAALVREGQFREDLYYRLNVVPIDVPPLRERREDIPVLAALFLERSAARNRKDGLTFRADTLAVFARYGWPGNVRELENLIERLVIFGRGSAIGIEDLPGHLRECPGPAPAAAVPAASSETIVPFAEVERREIVRALTQARGNVQQAAHLLGRGQATIYRKIKRYGIRLNDCPSM